MSSVAMSVIWMLLGAVLVLGGLYWWSRRKRSAGSILMALRRQLRRLTHDEKAADRLVAAERERHPALSEIALLRKVIRRLARDRR